MAIGIHLQVLLDRNVEVLTTIENEIQWRGTCTIGDLQKRFKQPRAVVRIALWDLRSRELIEWNPQEEEIRLTNFTFAELASY